MSRLKISTRLSAVLALMAGLLALVAAAALWQMGAMRSVAEDITGNWLPSVERVNTLNTNASDFRVAEFQHVLNTDDKTMAGIEQTMARLLSTFDTTHKAYIALISSDEERALHDRFQSGWQQYLQVHDRVVKLSRANQNDEARALLEGDASRLFDEASTLLDKLAELNNQGAAAATKASDAAYVTARNVLALALLVGLGVALAAGVWLVRSIVAPLRLAQQAADRVASGDLTGTIDTRSEDEAGQVLRALDRMQTSLAQVVSNVRQNSDSVATAAPRSRKATRTCPAAPRNRPAPCSRPRRRWRNSARPCATTRRTPSRRTSSPRVLPRWQRAAARSSARSSQRCRASTRARARSTTSSA